VYRRTTGHTEQEEASRLASSKEGKAVLEINERKAEELFRKASGIDPSLPEPYFGLGSLYEQQGKKELAIEAYRRYIELSQVPADKERAKRRLEQLTNGSKGGVK
jgi:tetratricopeptide (TPR) repeat protein